MNFLNILKSLGNILLWPQERQTCMLLHFMFSIWQIWSNIRIGKRTPKVERASKAQQSIARLCMAMQFSDETLGSRFYPTSYLAARKKTISHCRPTSIIWTAGPREKRWPVFWKILKYAGRFSIFWICFGLENWRWCWHWADNCAAVLWLHI